MSSIGEPLKNRRRDPTKGDRSHTRGGDELDRPLLRDRKKKKKVTRSSAMLTAQKRNEGFHRGNQIFI